MPNLKDLKGRIKSVKSIQKIAKAMKMVVALIGAMFMMSTAHAAPSTSPEELKARYLTFAQKKDCEGLLSLFNFTNSASSEKKDTQDLICVFDPPIEDVRYLPQRPEEIHYAERYNMPIVGRLEVAFHGDVFHGTLIYGTYFYVGEENGQYSLATFTPKGMADALGRPIEGTVVPVDSLMKK